MEKTEGPPNEKDSWWNEKEKKAMCTTLKLLMQVAINRNQDKPKEPIKMGEV